MEDTAGDRPEPVPTGLWASAFVVVPLGALAGSLAGASFVVLVTQLIKSVLAVVSQQPTWALIVVPLIGLAVSVLILNVLCSGEAVQTRAARLGRPRYGRYVPPSWYTFPRDVARADLTADIVSTAGSEEHFPWRLAPMRTLAIVSTVGLGAPMGTEAPAGHLGVAVGSWLGSLTRSKRVARCAALAGGAASVAALMGIPLVGTAFMLELGRRRGAPLSVDRVVSALLGGLVGWVMNLTFHLDLIRLITPQVAPDDMVTAIKTVLVVGVLSGAVTALAGTAIYTARGWKASPITRLLIGGSVAGTGAIAIAVLASPGAAVGPGGGAVLWAESGPQAGLTLLVVALLRALTTTAAVAAGGCGGVFVPFLAIGDISGRVFSAGLGIPGDLAGAAGAAGGIAGGYRLPWTAVAMVVGLGGPILAKLTCLSTVAVATIAGVGVSVAVDRLVRLRGNRLESAS